MIVYHFMSAEHALSDIRLRRLKVAKLNDLNDPFEALSLELADKRLRHALQSMKNKASTIIGLLCFSKVWSNPVMWSHYADKHKGLCLGFEAPENLLSEIRYSARRLAARVEMLLADDQSASNLMREILTTKYASWSYEQEMRMQVELVNCEMDGGLHFSQFSGDMRLAEVIVGSRCDVSRSQLDSTLGALLPSVECIKARLAFKSFSVVRNKDSRVW